MKRGRGYQDDADGDDALFDRDEDVSDDGEEDTFDPFDDDAGEELCEHGNHKATCEWCLEEDLEDDVAAAGADEDDED
jgi:hypothetical protein